MLIYSSREACFEHSNFFKVISLVPPTAQSTTGFTQEDKPQLERQYSPLGGPPSQGPSSTTSFLTATTLIYAIGSGITAAAGTRLSLQLFLVKGFKLYSFQLQDL